MPDKILRVLRWTCLLLAGTIGWQVYGIVTEPEPFDLLGDIAIEDFALETPPPAETTEETSKDKEETSKDKEETSKDKEETSKDKEETSKDKEETSGSTSKDSADGKASTPAGKDAGKSEGGKQEEKKGEQKKPDEKKGGKQEKKKEEQKKEEQKKEEQKKKASPPFPAALEVVATSGIFGKAPMKKPPPPALLGTLGKYAMIRSPDGKEDLVAEGGVLGGVKVIKISTNRVLIEYQDKQLELTVYSGFGSPTLLEPKKKPEEKKAEQKPTEKTEKNPGEKTEKNPEEKKKADAPKESTSTDSPKVPTDPK